MIEPEFEPQPVFLWYKHHCCVASTLLMDIVIASYLFTLISYNYPHSCLLMPGSPNPGRWTSSGLWPVKDQTTKQEVSGGDPEGRGYPREREAQERASPVPSSFTMPSPSALFCLSNALRSRTLRERKERQGDVPRPLPFFLPEPCSAPQWKVESHGKP